MSLYIKWLLLIFLASTKEWKKNTKSKNKGIFSKTGKTSWAFANTKIIGKSQAWYPKRLDQQLLTSRTNLATAHIMLISLWWWGQKRGWGTNRAQPPVHESGTLCWFCCDPRFKQLLKADMWFEWTVSAYLNRRCAGRFRATREVQAVRKLIGEV